MYRVRSPREKQLYIAMATIPGGQNAIRALVPGRIQGLCLRSRGPSPPASGAMGNELAGASYY
jgi:hypothetical protein